MASCQATQLFSTLLPSFTEPKAMWSHWNSHSTIIYLYILSKIFCTIIPILHHLLKKGCIFLNYFVWHQNFLFSGRSVDSSRATETQMTSCYTFFVILFPCLIFAPRASSLIAPLIPLYRMNKTLERDIVVSLIMQSSKKKKRKSNFLQKRSSIRSDAMLPLSNQVIPKKRISTVGWLNFLVLTKKYSFLSITA